MYDTGCSNKHPDWRLFREDHGHRGKYCQVCSEFANKSRPGLVVVRHTHFSSLQYRISANSDKWGHYFCPTCQIGFHSFKSGTRYPILVTSSMLHQWQGVRSENGYPGDPIHIDQLSIPGAKIWELEFAFLAEYSHLYRPCDIHLVSGLNNLLAGQNANQVMTELINFRRAVLHMNEHSSFAVSTLPLPPCMTKLTKDSYKSTRRDLTSELIKLNGLISEFNKETMQTMQVERAPRYHTWGLTSVRVPRTVGPRNLLEAMPSHAHQDWREGRPSNQLHLSDGVRLRMGKASVKYFEAIYGII